VSAPPPEVGLAMIAAPLDGDVRAKITRTIRRALREDEEPTTLPATPFVSIYERGRLIGCVGHARLREALRVARVDPRFGGARGEEKEHTIQVSFLARPRVMAAHEALAALEVSRHGLVALDAGRAGAVLLPCVARDGMLGPRGMLDALANKAGKKDRTELERVALVESERFVFRAAASSVRPARSRIDGAARWLAQRVGADGAIDHGVDARSGRTHRTGPFHLGRAAVVVRALAAHGGHARATQRARAWLTEALHAALAGDGDGLPRAPAERAGSLALAVLSDLPFRDDLAALARASAALLAAAPWHAAQVASALGRESPAAVVRAALAPIDAGVWAPWSALAADALGDRDRARRARDRIAASIATGAPHAGGAQTAEVPEAALTALSVEALALSAAHRSDALRALAFVRGLAFHDEADVPAPLDPALALGAVPLAPHADFLRSDVTGHAVLALHAARGL
jgi:AMMECR1 domain-containing protein